MNQKLKLEVSSWTVIKTILILVGFYILFLIKDVLALLFIVIILVSAFRPIVNKWATKIGNTLSVVLLFLLAVAFIVGFAYLIIPPLVEQTRQLISRGPTILEKYSALKMHFPSLANALNNFSQTLGSYTGSFISLTAGFLGGVVSFFTVIVLTLYVLIDQKFFLNMQTLIPSNRREQALDLVEKISEKTGNWLRGQLMLGLIMGLLTFIGLSIIRIPYALTLGVVAGILEIFPVIGPVIAGVFSAVVALSISPISALFAVALAVILQQLENNLIAPKILQKAIGLPPAIIIIAILIGGKLLGLVGALLAVPSAAIIYVVIQEWSSVARTKKND